MSLDVTRRTLAGAGLSAAAWPLIAAAEQSASAVATPPVTLVSGDIRSGIELSGTWNYSIDPYRDGIAGFHGEPVGESHQRYFDRDVEQVMRDNPTALFEFDMRRSPTTELPSSWLTHDASMRHYQGLVWYQRAFTAHLRAGQRAFLRFGAANYRAAIYLNGQYVGSHEGGFTPFAFEVTQLMRDGENRVTAGVDSQHTAQTVPPVVTDWETYGGLTRPVRLVITPATFIDDAWVRLTREGRIAASMQLNGAHAARQSVRVRIAELDLDLHGRTDASGAWSADAPAPQRLALWSPEQPKLYDVAISAAGDALAERIGFRTIAVRGDEILLNGAPIHLRGICIHEEEIGPNPTRNMTPQNARALLAVAKEGLGCNFVRLAHYPHSEVTTRLADEVGLMVWSEIPAYWRIDWESRDTLAVARGMLAENIKRDRNRASIILWSMANETPLGDARLAFLARLAADARALDDTRLITAALLTSRQSEGARPVMVLDDPLAAHLDVLGVNTYNGWYSPDPLASLPDIGWRSSYGKPMVFSEFGAGALAGFHDAQTMRKFSEEYQAEYYRQTLAMCARIPFLRGAAPWILKDFRSPRRQHPVFQQGWNRKGLISETGVRKAAFAVLAEHYSHAAAL
jgi:beta-glucuronidase